MWSKMRGNRSISTALRESLHIFGHSTLIDDQQAEFGVEANAVVDGLVRQSSGEILEEFAAGDITDMLFEHAGSQADALDQPAFSQAGLTDEDDVLLAADEV